MDMALTKPLAVLDTKRSSIKLENDQFCASLPIERPSRVSSGISSSAELVQEFFNIMFAQRNRWQETLILTPPNDVEKDIVVFLPPKKSRVVKLHIQNVYRPDPLIFLEE
jgi:hypothetical protein